jgi:anti-anti-sigma factor
MRNENISKGVYSIFLDTYMTSPNLSDFQKILNTLLSGELKLIILNFEDVIMIDSATIGYLFKIYKLSLEKNFKLKLVSLNEKILETLGIMGLDRLFDFYDNESDALLSLKYD